ncbi:MAG: hypothetical protein ACI4QZ_02915 [Eubacteriales bacterium]
MKLDRKALDRILKMDDNSLKMIVETLGAEAGLDLGAFNISSQDVASIRRALAEADEEDIENAARQLEAYKREHGGKK